MKPLLPTYKLTFLLVLFLFLSEATFAQFNIPPKPQDDEQHFVYDYIQLLTDSEGKKLGNKLMRYADSTSTQIVIAIIRSTNGEDISLLGAQWGQKWGVGQADKDNGIMIILAKDDRTVDINTGYGIEYRITDRMAEQVINTFMVPQFKKGKFYEGLDLGTDMLMLMLGGEFKAEEKNDFSYKHVIIIILFILFWIIMISASRKGRGGRGGGKGRAMDTLLDVIILSSAGRTGGGWSSGNSGGGWSGGGSFGGGFGGGGFGGGGASGSW